MVILIHVIKNRIIATASQKLCLFRLFPIIFHDSIDKLPSAIIYRQLREIIDHILSILFKKKWIPVLHDLLVAFHESMVIYFPIKIVPKLDFCTEYAEIISDYGPAKRQWSMRYEAYHSYLKKIALRSNNYKNMSKMLATRYRLKQIYTLCRPIQLNSCDQAVIIRKIKYQDFNTLMKDVLINHFGNIDLGQDLIKCNRFYHDNVEYRPYSVYITDLTNASETPRFIQVISIVKLTSKWWLLADILETVCYNDKLCAWEIKSIDNFTVLDPNCLKYYFIGLDLYELDNSSFVSFTARLTLY